MSLAFDAHRPGRQTSLPRAPESVFGRQTTAPAAGSAGHLASQTRAQRRHAARRDEQAVAAWLRELAARQR
jgi:hypothetical protein